MNRKEEVDDVSVKVILRGVVAGTLAAAILAFIMAVVDYNTALASSVVGIMVWAGLLAVAAITGWVAGRGADKAGWVHGSLAAMTIYLLGNLAGESFHLGSSQHLWLGIAVVMITGMMGGMWGASTQY